MIVVRVELWSARTGRKSELARMHICNDGQTTTMDAALGTYRGETFVGRSAEALDRRVVSRRGQIGPWPREAFHVWNLVARMLDAMGYDKRHRAMRSSGETLTAGDLHEIFARLYAHEIDAGIKSVWDAGYVVWCQGLTDTSARTTWSCDTLQEAAEWLGRRASELAPGLEDAA